MGYHEYLQEYQNLYLHTLHQWFFQLHLYRLNQKRGASGNGLIQQIYKYLNDNFSQPIGLTNVSEHVNRNPSYISRFIKQATGRKFSEILVELRLEEAKKLLRSSNLKITQIAEQVGYPNLQYFTRVFTGQMNMTPAEYRKITTYF